MKKLIIVCLTLCLSPLFSTSVSNTFIITLDYKPTNEFIMFIQQTQIAGIMLQGPYFHDANHVKETATQLQKNAKTPLFICVDQEGGRVNTIKKNITRYPSAEIIGKDESPDFAYASGYKLAAELKTLGVNVLLGPVADTLLNPNNSVIGDRSFNSSPLTTATLVQAYTKGVKDAMVMPVIKHFPGHGNSSEDSHLNLPKDDTPLDTLIHRDILPFLRAKNDSPMMMTGHLLFTSVDTRFPVSISSYWITDILRTEFSYTGLVMTDDIAMGALKKILPPEMLIKQALVAGNDIVLMTYPLSTVKEYMAILNEEMEKDTAFSKVVEERSKRIAGFKKRYGYLLFSN